MKHKKEILACRYLIKRLKAGYGANCKTKDIKDFPELANKPESRCASCLAKETIIFLKMNIKLLKD